MISRSSYQVGLRKTIYEMYVRIVRSRFQKQFIARWNIQGEATENVTDKYSSWILNDC